MTFDLLIKNGLVVDGTGGPGVVQDVGIRGDVITAVGDLGDADADQLIDATGRVVAPGFIDPHTHVDAQLFWDPMAAPLVFHGVTTAMTGNCAVTLAPVRPGSADDLARIFFYIEEVPLEALQQGVPWTWESFDAYLNAMDGKLGINCAALVGHCAIRHHVMGEDSLHREADQSEIERMRELLRDSLRAGAIGFSTSQNRLHILADGQPIPSRVASNDEILALCDVLGEEQRGLVQTDGGANIRRRAGWIRTFASEIARRTQRPVLAGNIFSTPGDPEAWRDIIAAVAECQQEGLEVLVQANPTSLDAYFKVDGGILSASSPTWTRVMALEPAARLLALRDPEVREEWQRETVETEKSRRDWNHIRVYRVRSAEFEQYVGRSIVEIAEERGVRIVDAFFDLALDDGLETEFVEEGVNNRDPASVVEMLLSRQAMIGSSDAGAHVKTFSGSGNTTFILAHWVRDRGAISLEQAVHRMTGDVADVLGFRDRGRLQPGLAADVVIFDLDAIEYAPARMVDDLPGGGSRLWRDAPGIDHVIVNGAVVVRDGAPTGALPGRVLRSVELARS